MLNPGLLECHLPGLTNEIHYVVVLCHNSSILTYQPTMLTHISQYGMLSPLIRYLHMLTWYTRRASLKGIEAATLISHYCLVLWKAPNRKQAKILVRNDSCSTFQHWK